MLNINRRCRLASHARQGDSPRLNGGSSVLTRPREEAGSAIAQQPTNPVRLTAAAAVKTGLSWLAVPAVMTLLFAFAPTASTASAASAHSFKGGCRILGNNTYAPATGTPTATTFTGTGTCSGSIDGRAPATYKVQNVVDEAGTLLSLGSGTPLPVMLNGMGSITLSGGALYQPVRIAFTIHQLGPAFTIAGVGGGSGIGIGAPNGAGTLILVHTAGQLKG